MIDGPNGGCRNQPWFEDDELDRLLRLCHRSLDRGRRAGGSRKTPCARGDRLYPTYSSKKDSNLLALTKQIAPMRRRHFVQRPAGPTAIEMAPASYCVALRAIDVMRVTCTTCNRASAALRLN